MASKTVYIKDADLEVFEKAERLGGDSISPVIAEALRRFVAIKKAEAAGMQEHTLEVGAGDDVKKVRFIGRELASGDW